jgi:sarcosine oxidase subunit alpha
MNKKGVGMREIKAHPILHFDRGKEVEFFFEGKSVKAYPGETVAMALYRNGVDVFSESSKLHRPRGMFCAIGKCSSCMMRVNGIPNVRTCILPVREGMHVERQHGLGEKPSQVIHFPPPVERKEKVTVIGGGPAGLSAAIVFAENGVEPLVIEQNPLLGGQLIKQTHKFFGSKKEGAGVRGIKIASEMIQKIHSLKVPALTRSSAFAFYPETDTLGVFKENQFVKVNSEYYLFATGAAERMIPFEGNDLPGVFGAGAAQTMMNIFGIKPGNRVLMIGAGNVGLIISYQLLQAGVEVAGVVEAAPRIGGYFVHAAKLRRFGVPIFTSTTIKKTVGTTRVEKAVTVSLNEKFEEIPNSEKEWDVDTVCLSTGLIPSVTLLAQAGCEMKFSPYLSGYVPIRNKFLMTTKKNIFVAGDIAGVEEASTAILEGKLAAYSILKNMGLNVDKNIEETLRELDRLRSGPFGSKIIKGLKEVQYE